MQTCHVARISAKVMLQLLRSLMSYCLLHIFRLQESMETKTETLSDLALEISPSDKVADLHLMLSGKLGWPPTERLER